MSHPAYPPGNPGSSTPQDPLDLPRYGAGFGEAVKRYFKKYATFSGRASRSEYWWIAVFNALVGIVAVATMIMGGAFNFEPNFRRDAPGRHSRGVAIDPLRSCHHHPRLGADGAPLPRRQLQRLAVPALLGAALRVAGRPDPCADAVQSGRRTLRQGSGLANGSANAVAANPFEGSAHATGTRLHGRCSLSGTPARPLHGRGRRAKRQALAPGLDLPHPGSNAPVAPRTLSR